MLRLLIQRRNTWGCLAKRDISRRLLQEKCKWEGGGGRKNDYEQRCVISNFSHLTPTVVRHNIQDLTAAASAVTDGVVCRPANGCVTIKALGEFFKCLMYFDFVCFPQEIIYSKMNN